MSSTVPARASLAVQADYSTPPLPSAVAALTPTSASKRFLYFAYGSNLLPSILALKKVSVRSARCGFIQDVQLLFDLKYSSLVEPCYANLQRRVGSRTHGVVYDLDARDMCTMDSLEGAGLSYVREEFTVSLYHEGEAAPGDSGVHETVSAFSYICHPDNLSQVVLCPHPPSKRYLDVLTRGAKHHKLDATYIDWLSNHPYTPLPELHFTTEQIAAIEARSITQAELEAHCFRDYMEVLPAAEWPPSDRMYTSLKGVVFDITTCPYSVGWMRNTAGKDQTLFTSGRVAVDGHDIPKSHEDFQPEHQAYVNATLLDLLTQYPIVGHMADRDKYKF